MKGEQDVNRVVEQYSATLHDTFKKLCRYRGHWLYFEPTAEISIDINPSLELELNRFNHVLSVES